MRGVKLSILLVVILLVSLQGGKGCENPSYNPLITARGGSVERIGTFFGLSDSNSVLSALPYSKNGGGSLSVSAMAGGKKITLNLELKNKEVKMDTDDLLVVRASGKGSYFNGKKLVRGVNVNLEYRFDRFRQRVDIVGTGSVAFKLVELETDTCY